jgi:3-methyladenine DNA glycosylase Mpg
MKQVLFMLLAAITFSACGSGNEKKTEASVETSVQTTEVTSVASVDPSTVYVYYFHGKQRCKTCIAVQKFAAEAVSQIYGDNQEVQFMEVMTDETNNKELVEKYGVTWNALIVAKGDDHIDMTQDAFANPEGVKELLKSEIDRRL